MCSKPEENKNVPKIPKKPPNAYFLFCADVREEITKNNPSLTISQIGKLTGKLWNELDEKKKDIYRQKSKKQKQEYDRILEEIVEQKKQQFQNEMEKIDQTESNQEDDQNQNIKQRRKTEKQPEKQQQKQQQPKETKPKTKPKRPQNPYFLFARSVRANLQNENPGIHASKLSVLIGEKWSKLSEEEKKIFRIEAEKERTKYQEAMKIYQQNLQNDHSNSNSNSNSTSDESDD
ncbi:high mobility group protein dsp1 [Anaeramoeba ignava]|uniref:High mobility group protein dsp1 n=1 Tax=Anaeramoeba ignava TaxID=1746090 RepID=A0A9Q0LCY8_ANAIG|nr:high mobility group protein dsp1 [Anaeramoeba ignava]